MWQCTFVVDKKHTDMNILWDYLTSDIMMSINSRKYSMDPISRESVLISDVIEPELQIVKL